MKELQSLSDIFSKKIYRIPDYQRGYAWGERQLQEFWEDLVNLSEDRMHYSGVLSLKAVDKDIWSNWNHEKWLIEDGNYEAFYIVDGQQRLTTFVIFIQALIEIVKQCPINQDKKDNEILVGIDNLRQIDESYIKISKPPEHIINTYKFGYERWEDPSFSFLRHTIFNEHDGGAVQETFYTLNLENTKTFFLSNLKVLIESVDYSAINTIYKKITQKLMFNVYEISNDFDVYVAFESMNNRGKKLSDLELLKNRLIYLTTLYPHDKLSDDVRKTVRENIYDAWKEVYYQLGRNKNNPLNDDDFLRAHWIMYFKYTRKKGKAYIRFLLDEQFSPKNVLGKVKIEKTGLKQIEELEEEWADIGLDENAENDDSQYVDDTLKVEEIDNYVKSLKESAKHWYNNHYPENNSDLTKEEQLWLDRLNRIGIGYFRPLIMSAFIASSVTSEERIKLLKAVERFIFLAFRLSRSPVNYRNNAYFNAARELYKEEKNIEQIISMLEEDLSVNFSNGGSFNHSDFKIFILRKFKDGKGFYDWNGLRYFLFEYEKEVMKTRGMPIISWTYFVRTDKDKVSIEHIYPQTPENDCWNEGFKEYSEEERKILQGTLGNLLPLSKSINSSLQNDCFEDKKQTKLYSHGNFLRNGYKNGSYSELEVAEKEKWTPVEIKERGLKLLKFMENRWNIKFKDDEKIDILNLNFIKDSSQ